MKYEYGVEYETNGEKPDLRDDILIEWLGADNDWVRARYANVVWSVKDGGIQDIRKFRIVDDRLKPKKQDKNDWYERGELPPVGTQCEVNHIGEWKPTVIVGYDAGLPVFKTEWNDRYAYACGDDFEFRPIRTERDVLVEKALNDIGRLSNDDDTYIIERLIAKGWRPVKQQNEVEFIEQCVATREHGTTSLYRSLYLEGCRFVEQGK